MSLHCLTMLARISIHSDVYMCTDLDSNPLIFSPIKAINDLNVTTPLNLICACIDFIKIIYVVILMA